MGFGLGAAFSGGLGYLGVKDTNRSNRNIASARNQMEIEEAQKARDFSAEQASINREFQDRMSSSAVSRRMKDMKSAGINPILAGKYEASSPAGGIGATAKANAHGYEAKNKMQGFLDNVSTVLQLKTQMANIENIQAMSQLTRNKSDVTSPVADVMGSIGDATNEARQDFKKLVKPSYQSLKNVIKDTVSDVGNVAGSSAKFVERKAGQVKHTYKNWWNTLKDDMSKFYDSFKNYNRLRGK